MKRIIVAPLLAACCLALSVAASPAEAAGGQRAVPLHLAVDAPRLAQAGPRSMPRRRGNWTSRGGRRAVSRPGRSAAPPSRRRRASGTGTGKGERREVKRDAKGIPARGNAPTPKPRPVAPALPASSPRPLPRTQSALPPRQHTVLLGQRLQAPPSPPGMPESAISLRTSLGTLPDRVRAGEPLPLRLLVNGIPLSLGRIMPRGRETEIVGQVPSGLVWLRAHADGEVTWEMTRQPARKGRKESTTARFRGSELARRVPPGNYTIRASSENGRTIAVTCHITMESPVCRRELDLR